MFPPAKIASSARSRKKELDLVAGGGRAFAQGGKRGRRFARWADLDVDVVSLQQGRPLFVPQVGFIGVPLFQVLERRFLVAGGFQKGKREGFGIEGSLSQFRDGFFDFDGVYGSRTMSRGMGTVEL